MRWMIFKVITFIAVFIFMQGTVLPWAVSNNIMPLWANIILLTVIVMVCLYTIDCMAYALIKFIRKNDEITQ